VRISLKKIAASLLVCALLPVSRVYAGETYDVYNYDRWGEAVPSQAGYTAQRSVSGRDLGTDDFLSLSDIFLSDEGLFYIADSGNNRIVVADGELKETVRIYDSFMYEGSTLTLKEPQSVFVRDKYIYIADTGNSRVIRSDPEGNADLVITKPESELYPEGLTFLPRKVIADKAGFVYAAVSNITSGAVMYDRNGEFKGFYGANRVEKTGKVVWDHFWKRFTSNEMRRYMTNSVPAAITSFDIDDDGFIYTCNDSLTQNTDAVKKVNAAGYNLFADLSVSFGDSPTSDYKNWPDNSYVDIDVSPDGLISCLDYSNGRIFQYDEDCNLLFIIGASGNQLGTFRQVTALESTSEHLYVTDSQKNTITVFDETSFGAIVHKATALYNDGYYEEALDPWYEVIKRDGNYRRAYIGIASALINRGDYSQAMKYAELADSKKLYNKAFEGWREEFVNKYFAVIAALIAVPAAASAAFLIIRRRKKRKE